MGEIRYVIMRIKLKRGEISVMSPRFRPPDFQILRALYNGTKKYLFFFLAFTGFFISFILIISGLDGYPLMLLLAIPFFFLFIWGTYKYLHLFYGAGEYPEFLHGRVKAKEIYEQNGVKFAMMSKEKEYIPGGSYRWLVMVENAHDEPREFNLALKLKKAFGKPKTEHFIFQWQMSVHMSEGEFGVFRVPLSILKDAEKGRYYVEMLTQVDCISGQGKRKRTKFGKSRSEYTLLQKILSPFAILFTLLIPIPLMSNAIYGHKFRVVDAYKVNHEAMHRAMLAADPFNQEKELEYFSFWDASDPQRSPEIVNIHWSTIKEELL